MRVDVGMHENTVNFLRDLNRTSIIEIDIKALLKLYRNTVDAENDSLNGLIAKYVQKNVSRTFHRFVISGAVTLNTDVVLEHLRFIAVDFSAVEIVSGKLHFKDCLFDEKCVGYEKFLYKAESDASSLVSIKDDYDVYPEDSVSQHASPAPRALTRSNLATLSFLTEHSRGLSSLGLDQSLNLATFQPMSEVLEACSDDWNTPTQLSTNLSVF